MTPYNTGKVAIGLRYTPPPSAMGTEALNVQRVLLTPTRPSAWQKFKRWFRR